jgi:hypothetical protein
MTIKIGGLPVFEWVISQVVTVFAHVIVVFSAHRIPTCTYWRGKECFLVSINLAQSKLITKENSYACRITCASLHLVR